MGFPKGVTPFGRRRHIRLLGNFTVNLRRGGSCGLRAASQLIREAPCIAGQFNAHAGGGPVPAPQAPAKGDLFGGEKPQISRNRIGRGRTAAHAHAHAAAAAGGQTGAQGGRRETARQVDGLSQGMLRLVGYTGRGSRIRWESGFLGDKSDRERRLRTGRGNGHDYVGRFFMVRRAVS